MIDDDDRLDRAIRAYQVPPPAEDLAERVTRQVLVAGTTPPVRAGRSWRRGLAALALIASGAAASLGLSWWRFDRPGVTTGEREAPARQTVTLGRQAVAVLEAGAALRWGPGPGRVLTVAQLRGTVFYRVDAGPFAVLTPGGTVNVRGTCFRVEVPDMKLTADKLKAATAGAALATAVMVTVYEGRVTFANRTGQVAVAAGESAGAIPGQPPALNAAVRRPGEEATRLALAAATLERVPRLSPAATPGERPSGSRAGDNESDWLAAPLQAVIQQVAQGREIEHLKVRPHGAPGKRIYNLDFDVDGLNHELDVDAEGKILTSEVDLPLTALPAVITRSVQSSYPAASLVDAELNQNEDMPRYYEIHIRRDGRVVELQVMEDGRIARELLNCPHEHR